MKKAAISRLEKDLISRITRLLNYSELINANLVIMERVCGNSNFSCIMEGKNRSLYLVTMSKERKRKMIYIPKRLEEKAKAYVDRYFKIKEGLEMISDINLGRLLEEKNR